MRRQCDHYYKGCLTCERLRQEAIDDWLTVLGLALTVATLAAWGMLL